MKITQQNEACEVHGVRRVVNKPLLFLMLAFILLVIWHVWVYGPTSQASGHVSLERPFLILLGSEIWDLLFNPRGIIAELWNVFPYFLAGILLAGYIRTYKLAVRLQRSFKRHGLLSVFLASLVGMITPLCACGTLTTAVGLLFARFPLAPVIALLVTSPLLSPSTYLLTLNDLGAEWTVIRTVAAFLMGMFAGTVTYLLSDRGFKTEEIFIEGAIPRGDLHDEIYPDKRLRCNCREKFGNRVAARTNNKLIIFMAKSSEMLWPVGKYILVGVAIGAIVERYMPGEWIFRLFGERDAFSIIWVTLGSVPVFLHQISASSILYHIKGTLNSTLDGGSAIAFMIGGPVTAMPTMIMLWAIFKKRVFFLYMFICIIGTIIIAYAFQWIILVPGIDIGNPLFKDVSSISGGKAAAINKDNKQIRIVMDSDGRAIIASYADEMGRGGVVFDSTPERFLNSSVYKYENHQYITNIAEWLGQNNNLSAEKSILIYIIGNNKSGDKLVAFLEKKGFRCKLTDRIENPKISESLLNSYSQLWIFFCEPFSWQYFSDAELETIMSFNKVGKGMLIAAGGARDADNLIAANQLSSRYGVTFSGYIENKEELPVSIAPYFFSRTSEIIGKILRFVHKA